MQRYYALITEVDTTLQRIIDLLKVRNLYNNTVIIFTTDNGFLHGEHGLSGKWYPYQESIRVPLIISDPRMTPTQRNTKNTQFIFNIDLAPTILSIANVSIPSSPLLPLAQQMQGLDITQLYLHPSLSRIRNNINSATTTTTTTTNNTIRMKNATTTNNQTTNNMTLPTAVSWRASELYYEHPTIQSRTYLTSSTAYITLNYSYMIYPEWNHTEVLYDLINDPYEQTNVISNPKYSTVLQHVRQRHAYW
jgi:arylsulfatase A-like enzyme